MDQGRNQNQINASNKVMATFLIAMIIFLLFTCAFNLIESKSVWLQKIEKKHSNKSLSKSLFQGKF